MATYGLPAWPWISCTVEDLPRAERLLLDGMRLWDAAARAGYAPLPAPHPPYVAEDATAAILPLDALMRAVRPALPPFGCPLRPRASPAEAQLLLACALAQRGGRREALALLLRLLPPLAAYAAMPAAIQLGIALGRAGLLLRNPLRPARG